jgi:hypothetical protein
VDWGTETAVPSDFGLAAYPTGGAYVLDIDKVSRLNSQNSHALSYHDIATSSKLSSIAVGFSFTQVMTLTVTEFSHQTDGGDTTYTFTAQTTVDSKPISATLHGYVIADGYLSAFNTSTDSGSGQFTVRFQSGLVDGALLFLFARAPFDERVTSYATYNFATQQQETTPASATLGLSPQNYTLSFNSTEATVGDAFVLSYTYQQPLSSIGDTQLSIPRLVDNSPLILVVRGAASGVYFAEWTAYPQLPLQCGSGFVGNEKNVFSYLVSVGGVLYRLDLALGDVPH